MTSITRWDPFRDMTSDMTSLREAMNQLVDQAIVRPGLTPLGTEVLGQGQMNVLELDGNYLCQVWLPGVKSDNIDLSVRQNTLTLQAKLGEPFTEDQRKRGNYLLREFGAGEISRTITFPKDVDGDHVDAQYDRGILTITLPIAQHAQPRRVKVNEASGTKALPYVESTPERQPAETASASNGNH